MIAVSVRKRKPGFRFRTETRILRVGRTVEAGLRVGRTVEAGLRVSRGGCLADLTVSPVPALQIRTERQLDGAVIDGAVMNSAVVQPRRAAAR
jgi:hypothetical protein